MIRIFFIKLLCYCLEIVVINAYVLSIFDTNFNLDIDLTLLSSSLSTTSTSSHIYSGADLQSLCREAAIEAIKEDCSRVAKRHFDIALLRVQPSISKEVVEKYSRLINNRL